MSDRTQVDSADRVIATVILEALETDASLSEIAAQHGLEKWRLRQWAEFGKSARSLHALRAGTAASKTNASSLLYTTLETSPSGIIILDAANRIVAANARYFSMWNMPHKINAHSSVEQILPHLMQKLKHPAAFRKAVTYSRTHPEATIHTEIELTDGRFFERHVSPYRMDGNSPGRIVHFVDITDYKKSAQKASQFGNLLHSVNRNVNEAILRSTPEEGLIYVNDAFVEIFGYDSKEEAMAVRPSDFYAKKPNRERLVNELKKKGVFTNEEVLFKRKDGSVFWGLENSTMIEDDGHIFIDAVVADIDDWKKAKNALRKNEKKYRSILKNMEEGYYETNLRGDLTFLNAAMVNILKYDADKLRSMDHRQIMDAQNAKKIAEKFHAVYQSGQPAGRFDIELQCGDSTQIFVNSSLSLRKNVDGKPIGFSGIIRDITERKHKQKQIADSLQEKEVLLGEIHHRVKNNLAIISGLLYLQADQTQNKPAREALVESQNRINSMALIHELLYENRTFASFDPQKYIQQLIDYISSNYQTDAVNIETSVHTDNFDLKMRTAIPCALIINELITNAFKYAFDGQKSGVISIHFFKKEDKFILKVADNGRGFPDDVDPLGEGHHSLGLSLVKTLVRQLRGKLSIENAGGAQFTIIFAGPEIA